MLKKALQLARGKTNSILLRLTFSFLAIIIMLVSFNFFSIAFSRQSAKEDVMQYNMTNLNHTTDNYEKHFELIKSLLVRFYFSDNVRTLANNQADRNYTTVYKTYRDIGTLLSNPLLYVDNLILHFQLDGFVLDKNTSMKADSYFSKLYGSKRYPVTFWSDQFQEPFSYKLLPEDAFTEQDLYGNRSLVGQYMPLLIKIHFQNSFYMIALIDGKELFNQFHNSINDHFYILNPDGEVIFYSGDGSPADLPVLESGESVTPYNGSYYFHKKGAATGYTYVNVVPDESIAANKRLNLTLVTLLIVSVIISVAVSILLSLRLNHPIKRMLQLHATIREDLAKKNAMLQDYAYMTRLKKIKNRLPDIKELVLAKKSYRFILFELTMKTPAYDHPEAEQRWALSVKEFIHHAMSQHYKDSMTLQMEHNQVLTILSAEPAELEHALAVLEEMRPIFDIDKEHGFLAISVSSIYHDALELHAAYEEALQLNQRRLLLDETQIILPRSIGKDDPYPVWPLQESEFDVHLKAGNLKELEQQVSRVLHGMYRRKDSVGRIYTFAEMLVNRVVHTLYGLRLDIATLGHPMADIRQCYSVRELESFLADWLSQAVSIIREGQDKRDHIADFVLEYVREHYAEDITLEHVAEKLHISGGYLSTYFKDKTGKNFIDYVHEVRIDKAKEVLSGSVMKIQDIAKEAGYHNMNSFHRMFKKFTGCTPSEYRKQSMRQAE
ncbi:helix-turn-helix domain-containing protein [Paenibacillus sp. J5C_2022]|uniref:helix-turn-helix domain-containing protein n=1 Tax=Paenibacillus sp. J5C2022 TaxID=2977129 RepID=UPI0021D3D2DA|nr:helix-turn-helix domain-containing protein [Paenibacillus sp. J5C2022]MCU6709582.1 helix-turn-helix domain-containing protein [Paenibacillus sp. J5C2022]